MKVLKINEYLQSDIDEPIKSFTPQKTLNKYVWKNDKIDPKIREELLKIAKDFYESLEVDVPYDDIILGGSICSYTYSSYSDFDLHIIVDFSKVNKDVELVSNYFYYAKSLWNLNHDIKIHDYDVEVFVQPLGENLISAGIFSLLNNKWLVIPEKINVKIDDESIKIKAEGYMKDIDKISEEINDSNYSDIEKHLKRIWDKIKKGRQAGLESGGELSVENLVFKLLRRNGYLEKIVNLKLQVYDKQHSIK